MNGNYNTSHSRQCPEDSHCYYLYVRGRAVKEHPPGSPGSRHDASAIYPILISTWRREGIPKGGSTWMASITGMPHQEEMAHRQLWLCFLPCIHPKGTPVPSSDPVEPEGFTWAIGGSNIKKMGNRVKVDSDQKATPPNVVCSKIGTIGKSE